jgi:ABC-type multidrug transport system ATPase subunit
MLDHLAVLKGLAEPKARKAVVEGLLEQVNLWEHRKRALAGYSGGMRQRFGIAQALIGEPQLIIVDEPTAGLDPEERNRFLNLLAEIGENVVVLLSTHIVADVADLCPAMAIISDGRSVDKDELVRIRASRQVISQRLFSGRTVVHVLSDVDPGEGFSPTAGGLDDVYFSTLTETALPARAA